MTSTETNRLVAGVVGAPRGLKGEVFVNLRTDRPELVFASGEVLETSDATWPELVVESAVANGNRLLVRFQGVDTREDAEAIRGLELFVDPEEEEDAWYPHQLVGLRAVDVSGVELGEVTALLPAPAHDLLVVRSRQADTQAEVLVPFVTQIVPEVDVEGGVVTLDPPPGLFPETTE